jgi:amylase-binding protein B (fragment)
LADAKKGKEKDKAKESDTKKENSETKKSDSNQYGLWIVIALVVVVGGFIAFKQFSNKKED